MDEKDVERFWAKVDRGADDGGCWIWTGGRFSGEYGRFKADRRDLKAHRVAYELARGSIPAGMFVCHRCDNPPCVNPAHLFIGTNTDNMADMRAKRRQAIGPRNWARRNPERLPRGADNERAKLDDAKVLEIRARYNRGEATQTQLAAEYGVRQTCISGIVRGRAWRHPAQGAGARRRLATR
jgi:hypothetical protein